MGCLFTCFRFQDCRRKSHSASDSTRAKSSVSQSPKRQLSSLFLLEDIEEDSPGNDPEDVGAHAQAVEIEKQLRDEARFLKACGTLLNTISPDEICGAFLKPNDSISRDESMEKPLIGTREDDEPPSPPVAIDEHTQCSSSRFNFLETRAKVKTAGKSVRFGNGVQIPKSSDSSPTPTPFKLTDEMQTPGTVFPASVELRVLQNEKKRVRAQYVRPAANILQWKVANKSGISTPARESWQPTVTSPVEDYREGEGGEASLSSWLRPKPSYKSWPTVAVSVRPHCNQNEPPRDSLSWWKPWNGNGIPNSTNKYKEDQKVKWHATPFEERLEKALHRETLISEMYANF